MPFRMSIGDDPKFVMCSYRRKGTWVARGSLNSAHIHGTHVPVEEPSTASTTDLASNRQGRMINRPPVSIAT